MAESERKYTYRVEIDAAQAKQQAAELRRTLEEMLGELAPAAQQRGGIAETLREAQKPAQDLSRTLEETQRRVRDLRNEYERMNQTAAATANRGTQRSRANFNTYVEEVRKAAGDDAAASARRMGRATNIGNLGAEFKDDESAHYLEAERDALRARQEAGQKMKFTAEEKRRLAELESQLAQAELEELRMRQQMAQAQKADADRLIAAWEASGEGLDAFTADIMAASDRLEAEIRQMAEDETQLLDSTARANQRLSALIEQQDADMRRAAAKATGTIMQAGAGAAGPGAYSQQAAITISQASAANAERFAVAMREAAEASERMERARLSTNVRGYELELEKQKAAIRQASEAMTAMQVEEARQATAAVTAEQRRQTANVQAEAQMRTTLVRTEADVARQEARAAAGARIEQEKRITAETRAQIRQREREQRLAQTATLRRPTAGGRPFSFGSAMSNLDMWTGMAAGGLGAFGVAQLAQQTYDAGRQGAILQRQAATFREFAGRMGQDANRIVEAVQAASGATITEFDAMGLASQVLASKFSQGSADIAADLETAVAASRRFSQIFLDENGQAMGVQEIFARLVKFAREGNKELVDQFGLSNQLIAEAMGTTVDGLASAQGATLRWQGLIKVLNSELERLGTAAGTTAERYEQSEARIADARQRIQMALAEPLAGVAEWGAGAAEDLLRLGGGAPIDLLARQIEQNYGAGKREPITGKAYSLQAPFVAGKAAIDAYNAALAVSAETTSTYAGELQRLLSALANRGTLDGSQVQELERLKRTLDAVALGLDAYSVAMSVTTMAGVESSSEIFRLVRSMGALQNMYEAGDMTLEQYSQQMLNLADRIRAAADANGYLNQEMAKFSTLIGPLPEGGMRRTGAAGPERIPFFGEESMPWALPAGMDERRAAVRYQQMLERQEREAAEIAIRNETRYPGPESVRLDVAPMLEEAQAQVAALSQAYELLGDSTTDAMTQGLDAMNEQISRLQLLDQAARLVDQAMQNGVSSAGEMAGVLTTVAAEVTATNTVTEAQVAILQRLIAALGGATAAAMGFAGAQTQYQAAMAAKNAQYEQFAGYNYEAIARMMDSPRFGSQERMMNAAAEKRRLEEEAARAWESAAKKTASEFERAAEQAAAAFESALRKVPGLFGASGVTGEQMAGAAAGVPQEFADNYLRRLADEVAGNKDWEGIDIRDAAARAGIDGNLPAEMILQQFRSAWDDSSLFAGGRNVDLITEYGGLDAIRANLARQEASASGQQSLLDFLSAQGLGPQVGAPGAPTSGALPAGLPTPEAAPDYATEAVAAIEQAFAADGVTAQLAAVGENTIAAIHAGYARNAGRLNWAGPLVDAVAAQVLESLNSALTAP